MLSGLEGDLACIFWNYAGLHAVGVALFEALPMSTKHFDRLSANGISQFTWV